MVKAHHHESSAGQRPRNVGIKAMEIYFPQTYVSQKDLEVFDGVSEGKYTIGLAQENMAVCSELEDINSMCMTAIQLLMDKYNLLPKDIGRIEVGTETIVDKSKAVKTALMQLFGENPDIEGVDSKNACYGGTAAVLNSQAWVESSAWDGRYAIALAGDIAVYEKGNARPTGGAGIVAMLIGPDAPLVFEPVRATHMEDVWDFYKPVLDSEYPTVDGHLSNICYQRSLDNCYVRYAERTERLTRKPFTVNDADYAIFHAPYNKLVQKSFGRYMWNDFLRFPKAFPDLADAFGKYQDITPDASYVDKHFLETLRKVSQPSYKRMVAPSELITKECGNSYCGSTYAGLLSLIANEADNLQNKRVLLFSYGSGSAATLFSVRATGDVASIRDHTRVKERLAARTKLTPAEFTELLAVREKTHAKLGYKPQQDKSILRKGTFYLSKIDDKGRRQYARAYSTAAATRVTATAAAAPTTSAASSVLPTVARALRRLAAL